MKNLSIKKALHKIAVIWSGNPDYQIATVVGPNSHTIIAPSPGMSRPTQRRVINAVNRAAKDAVFCAMEAAGVEIGGAK